jgi:hypothetical protein
MIYTTNLNRIKHACLKIDHHHAKQESQNLEMGVSEQRTESYIAEWGFVPKPQLDFLMGITGPGFLQRSVGKVKAGLRKLRTTLKWL